MGVAGKDRMAERKIPETAPQLVVANRFLLKHMLGTGGMASVWVAHHLTLNVDVAIKFIDPVLAENPELRSRFSQEAKAAAAINSPHVVSILDCGVDERDRPYIAMELLRGIDLADHLAQKGTLDLEETAQILVQASRGLSKAHTAKVIHRDLKPENLFLCDDEEEGGFVVKILDFGVAKVSRDESPMHKTSTGIVIGTPPYMSPEQATGMPDIDYRADLYSLGAVIYHCLTGGPPFEASALAALVLSIVSKPPRPVSTFRNDLPEGIDTWFARALHKDAADRFQSAREMADAFLAAISPDVPKGLLRGTWSDLRPSLSATGPRVVISAQPQGGSSARSQSLRGKSPSDTMHSATGSDSGGDAAPAIVACLIQQSESDDTVLNRVDFSEEASPMTVRSPSRNAERVVLDDLTNTGDSDSVIELDCVTVGGDTQVVNMDSLYDGDSEDSSPANPADVKKANVPTNAPGIRIPTEPRVVAVTSEVDAARAILHHADATANTAKTRALGRTLSTEDSGTQSPFKFAVAFVGTFLLVLVVLLAGWRLYVQATVTAPATTRTVR